MEQLRSFLFRHQVLVDPTELHDLISTCQATMIAGQQVFSLPEDLRWYIPVSSWYSLLPSKDTLKRLSSLILFRNELSGHPPAKGRFGTVKTTCPASEYAVLLNEINPR